MAKGKITFPMLWDPTADTWRRLGIASQPAAVLVSTDGREIGRWLGRIDTKEKEILSRLDR